MEKSKTKDEGSAGMPDVVSDKEILDNHGPEHSRRRHATLYDAVAGRVINRDTRYDEGSSNSNTQSLPRNSRTSKYAMDRIPYGPDEVLFRRKDAPQRFEEHDIYASHIHQLPSRDCLPDSDLLKAVHSYASHFYSPRPGNGEEVLSGMDERSMDETALLAFGILLEEAGKEALGRRGHLVFTEAKAQGGEERPRQTGLKVGTARGSPRKRRKVGTPGG